MRKSRRVDPAVKLRNLSEARKLDWAQGRMRFAYRLCAYCETEFAPRSGSNIYCKPECKAAARYAGGVGLTRAVYRGLTELQMGACALCGAGRRGFTHGRPLQVDHDHRTGEIRGLLCGDCNTALGRFGDDPARLRAAARYLANPPSRRL